MSLGMKTLDLFVQDLVNLANVVAFDVGAATSSQISRERYLDVSEIYQQVAQGLSNQAKQLTL